MKKHRLEVGLRFFSVSVTCLPRFVGGLALPVSR